MESLPYRVFDKYAQGAFYILHAALKAAEIAHAVTKKVPGSGRIVDSILGPEELDLDDYISPTVAPPRQQDAPGQKIKPN